jgi:hypothetical protein
LDLDAEDEDDAAWADYPAAAVAAMEAAYATYRTIKRPTKKQRKTNVDAVYAVDFHHLVQFRLDDPSRQRAIRRVE